MRVTTQVITKANHIQKRVRGIKTASDAATWKAATIVRDEMLNRAPRRNSHAGEKTIAESITIVGKQGDEVVQVGSVGAHRNRPVAAWNEFGTARQRARPFARPAAARGRKALKEEAESKIRNEVNSDG